MTINLAARGLAATMIAAPDNTLILLLLGAGEHQNIILGDVLTELPDEAIRSVKRSNGAGRIRLINGTKLVFQPLLREGRGLAPAIVVETDAAHRTRLERSIDLRPLLSTGAELATF